MNALARARARAAKAAMEADEAALLHYRSEERKRCDRANADRRRRAAILRAHERLERAAIELTTQEATDWDPICRAIASVARARRRRA